MAARERIFPREAGTGDADQGIPIRCTIVRATQFVDFASSIAKAVTGVMS